MLLGKSSLVLLLFTLPVLSFGQKNGSSPDSWPTYNYDLAGTRFNSDENTLKPENVRNLSIKWTFPTAGDVYGTPAVGSKFVGAGDTAGYFYALTLQGGLSWTSNLNSAMTASALITDTGVIVIGDQAGNIHGLDMQTGHLNWSVRPNSHAYAAIFGSAIYVNGSVIIGIASNEESLEGQPSCCTFRGSVVSLNPANGAVNWQTYLISPAELRAGSSGAPVWSTPTYDSASNRIYVTTGNNYSGATPSSKSDAIVALDPSSGAILWTQQPFGGDSNFFTEDYDFADSAQVYTLANGQKVVGAGNKNGAYYVADAATGRLISSLQVTPNCGYSHSLFADSGVAYNLVFVNGINCQVSHPWAPNPDYNYEGVVAALSNGGAQQQWQFTTLNGPVLSGLAIANGIVYFNSTDPTSILYALNAQTGQTLAAVPISGGISGPAVSGGRVFVGTGEGWATGVATPASITALGP